MQNETQQKTEGPYRSAFAPAGGRSYGGIVPVRKLGEIDHTSASLTPKTIPDKNDKSPAALSQPKELPSGIVASDNHIVTPSNYEGEESFGYYCIALLCCGCLPLLGVFGTVALGYDVYHEE